MTIKAAERLETSKAMDAEEQLNFTCPPFVHLESAFLAMEPPDCLISLARVCGGGSVTEKVQRFIWNNCISKPDGNFYAPYLKRFLKKLIVEVESTGSDVLDELYETYASYMTSLKDDDSSKGNSRILKWVSFLFPDDCPRVGTCLRSRKLVIPLQCSLNLLEGDTGCSIWPSSLFLSEFILSSPEIFSSKSCFEVGSGVGLVGICLAHVGASKVILSDGDLSSLANMKLNLELNKLGFRTNLLEATTQEKTNMVQCKYLAWESAPENELQDLVPDIVLGADVIYNPSCIPHLIRVLALLLHRGKSDFDRSLQNGKIHNKPELRKIHGDLEKPDLSDNNSLLASTKGPVAYIAYVIRNIDTFNYFLRQAEEANLVVTDITGEIRRLNLLPYMQSYPSADVRLFHVSFPCQ